MRLKNEMEQRDANLKEDYRHTEVLNDLYNMGIIDSVGNLIEKE